MAKPSKKRFELSIREVNYIKKQLGITKIEDVDKAAMKRLKEKLKTLTDSRIKKKTKFKYNKTKINLNITYLHFFY